MHVESKGESAEGRCMTCVRQPLLRSSARSCVGRTKSRGFMVVGDSDAAGGGGAGMATSNSWPAAGVQKQKRRSGPKSKTSPYIGVTQYKKTLRWEAHIWIADSTGRGKGGQKHLGSYNTAEEAAQCYDRAAIRTRGPHAELNFPYESYKDDAFLKENLKLSREPFLKLMRERFAIQSPAIVPRHMLAPIAARASPVAPRKLSSHSRSRSLSSDNEDSHSDSPSDASTQPSSPPNGMLSYRQHFSAASRAAQRISRVRVGGLLTGHNDGSIGAAAPAPRLSNKQPAQQVQIKSEQQLDGSGSAAAGNGSCMDTLDHEHDHDLLVLNPLAHHALAGEEEEVLWGLSLPPSPLSGIPLEPLPSHMVPRSATYPMPAVYATHEGSIGSRKLLVEDEEGNGTPQAKVRRVATAPGTMQSSGGGFAGLMAPIPPPSLPASVPLLPQPAGIQLGAFSGWEASSFVPSPMAGGQFTHTWSPPPAFGQLSGHGGMVAENSTSSMGLGLGLYGLGIQGGGFGLGGF